MATTQAIEILCQCRSCGTDYDPNKSRADYKGYCSQACFHAKAKALGWRKSCVTSEYRWLHNRNEIGDLNYRINGFRVGEMVMHAGLKVKILRFGDNGHMMVAKIVDNEDRTSYVDLCRTYQVQGGNAGPPQRR